MVSKVGRLTFVRQIYRRLLERGRTYAAFDRASVFPLVQSLHHHGVLLDPMSGYGTLMTYCSELGIGSYSVELNPPPYYWQVLTNPGKVTLFSEYVNRIRAHSDPPRLPLRASVADGWFSEESKNLALEVLWWLYRIAESFELPPEQTWECTLALYLPFVGRFSTYIQGNIVIGITPGGICVHEGWFDDFGIYLQRLEEKLSEVRGKARSTDHCAVLGDCRTLDLTARAFTCFVTSPSYPSYKDYARIFAPENEFLRILYESTSYRSAVAGRLIGTTEVRQREPISLDAIHSVTAREFLEKLSASKGKKKQLNDIRSYYLPYFLNYFKDVQDAYENFVQWMAGSFEGYVIVVDNTSRGEAVPVGQFSIETFASMGLSATSFDHREKPHVGTLNPSTKGQRARHMEHTIRVSRHVD